MNLELDDFSQFHSSSQEDSSSNNNEDNSENGLDQLRRYYEEKIQNLERSFQETLSKVREQSYEEAFRKIKSDYEQKLQNEIEKIIHEKEREKEHELRNFRDNLMKIEKELIGSYKNYIEQFSDLILDSLHEILEFLYIDSQNVEIVQKAINDILNDFPSDTPFSIQVPTSLYKQIQNEIQDLKIKANSALEGNDFIVEFDNFKIENKIKEKIGAIKNELKREVKKLT